MHTFRHADLFSHVSLVVGVASLGCYDGTGLMRSLGEAGEETAGVLTRTPGLTPSCQSLVSFNGTPLCSPSAGAWVHARPVVHLQLAILAALSAYSENTPVIP